MLRLIEKTHDSRLDIMLNYRPVYPGSNPTWADTISFLVNQPTDWKVVSTLMKRLKEDGTFREPILLETSESREQSSTESRSAQSDLSPLHVLDGTHRVAAAYLIQHLSIPVAYDEHPTIPDTESFRVDLQMHILETAITFENSEDVDDAMDVLFEASSFELSRDIWMTSSVISGVDNTSCMMWDLSEEEIGTLADHEMESITQYVCQVLDEAEVRYHNVYTSVELLLKDID